MHEAAERALAAIRARSTPGPAWTAPVDVHFQPDAPAQGGRSVLQSVAEDGRWRTQWETGTSNGGLTAFPGGDRFRWESRLFEGAYDESSGQDRPVYGATALESDGYGAAPRFGSAFLRLRPSVLGRVTLAFPDSVFSPTAFGTPALVGSVSAAFRQGHSGDPLDDYVEAHVHGGLELRRDVERLVLDPSFRDTGVEDAATATGLEIAWHPGYRLERLDEEARAYRGDEVAAAAIGLIRREPLTPASLGRARGDLDPPIAKRVWHLLARFGRRPPLPRSANVAR